MLDTLYDQLENHLKRRDQLAIYMMLYGGSIMYLVGLPNKAYRFAGALSFYGALAVVVAVIGFLGLYLLVEFIKNRREILLVKEEIAVHRQPTTRYAVGDDGELIPVTYEHETEHDRHKAAKFPRIRL